MNKQTAIKLSICIPTFNRADFIGATLESIVTQATEDCEIIVSDNASTDGTELVVSEYGRRFSRLRYIRQHMNVGLDRNYDRAVEVAQGEYCWLMTDDDFLMPGAVAAVLKALLRDLSLVLVNVEARDFSMSKVLRSRWLDFESDRVYTSDEMDQLVLDTGVTLRYIGCIVIKRAIWLLREKDQYYGSLFIHLGVILQERLPGETLVIAEPCVSYRMGNAHTFSRQEFELYMVELPTLVRSLALSEPAKNVIQCAEPWRSVDELLLFRAMGSYSLADYRRWISPQLRSARETCMPVLIALLPGVLVNAVLVFYYSVTGRLYRGIWDPEMLLEELRTSRFYLRNWRIFKRAT